MYTRYLGGKFRRCFVRVLCPALYFSTVYPFVTSMEMFIPYICVLTPEFALPAVAVPISNVGTSISTEAFDCSFGVKHVSLSHYLGTLLPSRFKKHQLDLIYTEMAEVNRGPLQCANNLIRHVRLDHPTEIRKPRLKPFDHSHPQTMANAQLGVFSLPQIQNEPLVWSLSSRMLMM